MSLVRLFRFSILGGRVFRRFLERLRRCRVVKVFRVVGRVCRRLWVIERKVRVGRVFRVLGSFERRL